MSIVLSPRYLATEITLLKSTNHKNSLAAVQSDQQFYLWHALCNTFSVILKPLPHSFMFAPIISSVTMSKYIQDLQVTSAPGKSQSLKKREGSDTRDNSA